jgi:tryptophan synthase beta chain
MQPKKLLDNPRGRYGEFGGMYVPELLMQPISELIMAWDSVKNDFAFRETLTAILKNYAGRPTALTEVYSFSEKIYCILAHTN